MLKPVATVALVLASLMTTAGLAHAQSSVATTPGFELLVPSGTVVPTGAQEDDVKRANVTAVQLSYGLRPDPVLTSTVGWARTTPLGMGAGPQVLTHLPWFIMMGLAWTINAVLAEFVIRTRLATHVGATSWRARPVLLSTT